MFGLGTVGASVYRILEDNRDEIERKIRASLRLKSVVVRNPSRTRGIEAPPGLITTDPSAILDNPEIDLVVEVMGGVNPARDYLLTALSRGKSVVTANKEVIADYGDEIFSTAERAGVDVFFEGSVGGGIPVLRPLKENLAASRIHRVMGIINGTTNYILTQMAREGKTFQQALLEAQEQGYAEADPSADVEGGDAARKLAILASIAFHSRCRTSDVLTEGITKITPEDISFGSERGWVLKLLAMAREEGGEFDARVHPAFIGKDHPLASVSDVYNAICVYGDEVGETMFYGRGAGGLPTASAVVGDIVEAARNRQRGVNTTACSCYRQLHRRAPQHNRSRFYIRLSWDAREASLASLKDIFLQHNISVEQAKESGTGGQARGVIITGETPEGTLVAVRPVLERLPGAVRIENIIRIVGDAA